MKDQEQKLYKQFTYKSILTIIILLLIVASLNYFFDPYGIYNNRIIIKNLNDRKPMINSHTRIHKTQKVFLNHYDCIFLGTSRVEASMVFDKYQNYIKKYCNSYYNAALSSSNIVEMYYMLLLVLKYSKPKKIFYGLDFLQFNAETINYSLLNLPFFEKPLYTRITYLFSYDMIKDMIRTFKSKEESYYDEYGGWNIEKNYLMKFPNINLNTIFLINEKAFYYNFFKEFSYKSNNINTWEYYIKILKLMNDYPDIEFYFYINPFHARLLEVMDLRNMYDLFEQWKKELVLKNKNFAYQTPIYDFSGYNFITTEPVNENTKESLYFYDSSHIKKIVGIYILDYILNQNKKHDFGIKLTNHNIAFYLREQQNKRKIWKEKNKKIINQIRNFIINQKISF
ncbi:MAG: hypothetical protein KatS3mg129_0613 [Leptospiraceae bacterium]|nr:MAG: hypothetical protein KatS3mg129_0613 [Leptospiraceae bacterium]